MKKVIFTESQLSKILGEDIFSGYLGNKDDSAEVNPIEYGTEISISDFNDTDNDLTDTGVLIDLDKIGKELGKGQGYPNVHRQSCTPFAESIKKKRLFEVNQDYANKKMTASADFRDKQAMSNSQGLQHSEMIRNIAKGNQTGASMAKTKSRLTQLKKEDPLQYMQLNGDKALKALDNTLNREKFSSKTRKEVEKNMGNNNAFKKPSYKTEKNKNKTNFSVTYEN